MGDLYLFVCEEGVNRSRLAAEWLQARFDSIGRTDRTGYCGVARGYEHEITPQQIREAWGFFAMEIGQKNELIRRFSIHPSEIEVLDILDVFDARNLPNGEFSEDKFGNMLDGLTNLGKHSEIAKIQARREIAGKWSIGKVLEENTRILHY